MTGSEIENIKDPRDKWILVYFLLFFGCIIAVNAVFVYKAISTQPGVVADHTYARGLKFDQILEEAKQQPQIQNKITYEDGMLRWSLPVENATVTAKLVRPVQDGYDFEVTLSLDENGVYAVPLDTPLPGVWTAHLKAKWDDQQFQSAYDFVVQ